METIVVVVIASVLLAMVLFKATWSIVSSAVDNLYRWVVYTFGNEDAVNRLKQEEGG